MKRNCEKVKKAEKVSKYFVQELDNKLQLIKQIRRNAMKERRTLTKLVKHFDNLYLTTCIKM